MIINENTTREELLQHINDLKEKLNRSVTWSNEDFCGRARNLFDKWLNIDNGDYALKYGFDANAFDDCLDTMIYNHDANHGISWDTIDYYLQDDCIRPFLQACCDDYMKGPDSLEWFGIHKDNFLSEYNSGKKIYIWHSESEKKTLITNETIKSFYNGLGRTDMRAFIDTVYDLSLPFTVKSRK